MSNEFNPEVMNFMNAIGDFLSSVRVNVEMTKEEWDLTLETIDFLHNVLDEKDVDIDSGLGNKRSLIELTDTIIDNTMGFDDEDTKITIELTSKQFAELDSSIDFTVTIIKKEIIPALRALNFLSQENSVILTDKIADYEEMQKSLNANVLNVNRDDIGNSMGSLFENIDEGLC